MSYIFNFSSSLCKIICKNSNSINMSGLNPILFSILFHPVLFPAIAYMYQYVPFSKLVLYDFINWV